MENELLAVVTQSDHAVVDRFGSKFVGGDVGEDHVAKLIVHDHQFKQSDAAFVAGVVADVATFTTVELLGLGKIGVDPKFLQQLERCLDFFPALRADASH